jgi:hypothetical protein
LFALLPPTRNHEISEDHQVFVVNSVICNSRPLDLEALQRHHTTGYASRRATHDYNVSLNIVSVYDSVQEHHECYDTDDDMEESDAAEKARLAKQHEADAWAFEDEEEEEE